MGMGSLGDCPLPGAFKEGPAGDNAFLDLDASQIRSIPLEIPAYLGPKPRFPN